MPTRLVQESRHPAGHASLMVVDAALVGKEPATLCLMIVKSGEVDSFLDPDRSDGWASTPTSFVPNATVEAAQGVIFDIDDSVTYSLRANTSYRLRVLEGASQIAEHGFAMPATFRRRSSPPARWMATPQPIDHGRTNAASLVGASTVPEAPISAAAVEQQFPVPPSVSASPSKPVERSNRVLLAGLAVAAVVVALVVAWLMLDDSKPPAVAGDPGTPPTVGTPPIIPPPREVPSPAISTLPPPASPSTNEQSPPVAMPSPPDAPAAVEKRGVEPALPTPQPEPAPAPTAPGPIAPDPAPAAPQAPAPSPQASPPPQAPQQPSSTQSGQPQDLAACRSMLQSTPSAAAARDLAQQLSQSGRMPDCQLLLARFAANQGDAASARIMGTMYDPATWSAATSPMPNPNPREAERWYRRAAESGDVDAQYRYAMLLRSGHLGAERRAESAEWLAKAAGAGNEAAKRELAK